MERVRIVIRSALLAATLIAVAVQPLHALAACCCTLTVSSPEQCCQAKVEKKSCCASKLADTSTCDVESGNCHEPANEVDQCACCVKRPADLAVVTIDADRLVHESSAIETPVLHEFVPNSIQVAVVPLAIPESGKSTQSLLCVWRN